MNCARLASRGPDDASRQREGLARPRDAAPSRLWLREACAEEGFRLTAFAAGARGLWAAGRDYGPSVRQWRGNGTSAASTEKTLSRQRSRLLMAPRWLGNPGVESPQQKGDSRWTHSRWTNWATRLPSCRPTSTPRPRACSTFHRLRIIRAIAPAKRARVPSERAH